MMKRKFSQDVLDLAKMGTDILSAPIGTKFEENVTEADFIANLIELNGGSNKLDYRAIRRGKLNEMFEVLEVVVSRNVASGLSENAFFQEFVEYKEVDFGDKESFYVPDDSLFTVANLAMGNWAIERQRINKGTNKTIDTSAKGIKAYENIERLLAGRITLTEFVDKISKSLLQKRLELAYAAFDGGLANLPTPFKKTGSYVEATMLSLIEEVEIANAGKEVIVIGTRGALRKITVDTSANGESAKSDKYNLGYYGNIGDVRVLSIKQANKVGTNTRVFNDNKLYVIAGDDKPVKFITEGTPIIDTSDLLKNVDGTVDVMAIELTGAGTVFGGYIGEYDLA